MVLSEPVRLLVSAVDAVHAQCAAELPGPQALQEARVLIGELDRLRAVALARLSDIDVRGLHSLDAAPSTSSWVERQDIGLGRDDVALARKLPRLPAVADAIAAGTLSLAAAAQLGQALDKVRRHLDRRDGLIAGRDGEQVLANVIVEGVLAQIAEARGGYDDDDPQLHDLLTRLVAIWEQPNGQLARLEHALVLLAQHLERSMLGQALDRLVDAILPDRLADAAEQAHARRGVVLRRNADGSGWTIVRGDLDLELGSYLATVLAAARATDPDNPTDTAAWTSQRDDEKVLQSRRRGAEPGTGPIEPAPTRPAPADADADAGRVASGAAGRAADPTAADPTAADPTALPPGPRSRAQQDHDALKLALRRLLDAGELGSRGTAAPHLLVTVPHAAMNDEPGALLPHTVDGTTIPTSLARRLVCDSRLTRVVLSLGRRVLEVSHSERTLKAHERLALHVQWNGRCAGAGRTSPTGALAPHHATPWHRAGTTSLRDTVPLCPTTHHDLHDGGKIIRLRDGRYLGPHGWARGPDG